MTTTTSNDGPAPDLTEAVIALQAVVRRFFEDLRSGRQVFVLNPSYHSSLEGEATTVMSLVAADERTMARLKELQQELMTLEKRLRLRGEWLPPESLEDALSSTFLDVPDLSNAINILGYLVSSTSPAGHYTP